MQPEKAAALWRAYHDSSGPLESGSHAVSDAKRFDYKPAVEECRISGQSSINRDSFIGNANPRFLSTQKKRTRERCVEFALN